MTLTMIPDVLSFQISYSNVQTRQFTLTNYPPNPSMNALMFNAYALGLTASHIPHTHLFSILPCRWEDHCRPASLARDIPTAISFSGPLVRKIFKKKKKRAVITQNPKVNIPCAAACFRCTRSKTAHFHPESVTPDSTLPDRRSGRSCPGLSLE